MENTNIPKLVTVDILESFKKDLLKSIGISVKPTNNNNHLNSIIQKNSLTQASTDAKIVNSAIFGLQHDIGATKTLKNVFITGQGNIASNSNQTILGQFNASNPNALFIIGNGTGDTNRNNAFTVLKNGNIKIGTCELGVDSNQLLSNKRIAYDSTIAEDISNLDSFNAVKNYLNDNVADNELIPANIFKQILNYVLSDEGISPNIADGLIPAEGISYSGADANKKALSITAAKELDAKINQMSDNSRYQELSNKLDQLKQDLSYLLSCITVDKITNEDGSIEYYSVGLADYALDMDTTFTFEGEENN